MARDRQYSGLRAISKPMCDRQSKRPNEHENTRLHRDVARGVQVMIEIGSQKVMRTIMRSALIHMAAALLQIAASAPSLAQGFPGGKPVEMTVMFGAGSAADVTARHLADGMAKHLGVPVPVVNRTGGGGGSGYSHVSRQKPDGHSIIWNSNSISSTYHSGVLPFDYRAFDPVARVSVETPVIAVRVDAPWKTLDELIAHARTEPGKVRIGNSGTGSHTHFSASALFATAGAKAVDVPFGEGQ